MRDRRRPWVCALALVAVFHLAGAAPAYSEDGPGEGHDSSGGLSSGGDGGGDHDEARYLVDHGNIRPLPEVLQALHTQVEGDVIDVRLRLKDLRWIYWCKLVTPTGRRLVVPIDAASLVILDGARPE